MASSRSYEPDVALLGFYQDHIVVPLFFPDGSLFLPILQIRANLFVLSLPGCLERGKNYSKVWLSTIALFFN